MRVYTKKVNINANSEATYHIRLGKDELLFAASAPGPVSWKFWKDTVRYSEVKAAQRGFTVVKPEIDIIPVLSEAGKTVKAEIKALGFDVEDYVSFMIAKKDELRNISDAAKDVWIVASDDFGETLDTDKHLTIFQNRYDFDVFLAALIFPPVTDMWTAYEIYKNEDKLCEFTAEPIIGSINPEVLPLYVWLRKGDKVTVKMLLGSSATYLKTHCLLSRIKYRLEDDIFFDTKNPIRPPIKDTTPNINKIINPIPIPKPNPLPSDVIPYPRLPSDRDNIEPTIKVEYPTDTTTSIGDKETVAPHRINRDDEQKVIEPLPSPYGTVRKTADPLGRVRTTRAYITYRSGKLDVTTTDENLIFQGDTTKEVNIYAKAGNWEIKVLPIYEFLAGRTIDDMPTIYIDEGQSFNMEIEAKQVKAKCTSATETEPGTLYWLVGV